MNSLENTNLSDRLSIEYNKKFSQTLARIKRDLGTMEPYEVFFIFFVSLNIFGVEGNIRSPLSSLVCFVTTDENGLSCFYFDAEVFESYKISAD